MDKGFKIFIVTVTLVLIATGIYVGLSGLESEQNISVNGEVAIKFEQKRFYLGEQFFNARYNHYYFHGIDNHSNIVIGHYSSHGDEGGMSNVYIPITDNMLFTIDGRAFRLVETGRDFITLEWEVN